MSGRRRQLWLRDLLSLHSRLSLADFEAPDDLLVEAVQAPAQTAVWFSEISTRAQPVVSSAPALPAQDISPLIKASLGICCPAHLPANDIIRRSFLGPRHSHSHRSHFESVGP